MNKIWKPLLPYILMIPSIGFIFLLIGSSLKVVLFQSFGISGTEEAFTPTLSHWHDVLSDPIFFNSVKYSMRTSTLGALGSVIIAYPVALWLRNEMPAKLAIVGMTRIPMFIPGLVAAFLMMNLISYHGLINQFLMWTGIIDKPIRMANDSFGWGVVFLQVWKNLPFALLLLGGAINGIRTDLFDACADLGADLKTKFFRIILPLTIPALQASLVLVFIRALGDFSFASIAGSRTSYSLSMLMNMTATTYYEWEKSAVIAIVIMALALLSALIMTLVTTPIATNRRPIIK